MRAEIKERLFAGYDVPEQLKVRASAVAERFSLTGICDPMYVANMIAFKNGLGDGCGHFTEWEEPCCPDETAEELIGAYGCNMFPEEKGELAEIIRTGEIDPALYEKGLRRFMKECRRIGAAGDKWRREYMRGCIARSRRKLKRLKEEPKWQ